LKKSFRFQLWNTVRPFCVASAANRQLIDLILVWSRYDGNETEERNKKKKLSKQAQCI